MECVLGERPQRAALSPSTIISALVREGRETIYRDEMVLSSNCLCLARSLG